MFKKFDELYKESAQYSGGLGKKFQYSNTGRNISMPVLHFLWGCKWQDCFLSFIEALQPSTLRIGYDKSIFADNAVPRRVTVILYEGDTVRYIAQEVCIGNDIPIPENFHI